MSAPAVRRARLEPLLESARCMLDAESERGQRTRTRLVSSTGLSPEGVNFGLERCLEARPSEAELEALLRSTPEAPRAHVLLSANVFVAAHRAIAIGLAASREVRVRASRREPDMAELLLEGAPGSFELVDRIVPEPRDHLWAYGSDETLQSVTSRLERSVVVHAHGTGFGIGVIAGRRSNAELEQLLPKLAEDTALFDQRGCLSPRVLFVTGGAAVALDLAQALAAALGDIERRIPRGQLAVEEAAEISRYCETASYAGELFEAGLGFVSTTESFLLPPVGRNLHVLATNDVLESLAKIAPLVTSCAFEGDSELQGALTRALPGARMANFGQMQRPPFDGPVDRRMREP